MLGAVPGAKDVTGESRRRARRELAVRLRPERLTQFGYRPVEVMEAIQTAYQGTVVAQVHRGNQVADVAVILEEASRRDPEGIRRVDAEQRAGVAHAVERIGGGLFDHRPIFDHARWRAPPAGGDVRA